MVGLRSIFDAETQAKLDEIRNSRGRPKAVYYEPFKPHEYPTPPREYQIPPPDYPNYRRRKLWKTISARVLHRDRYTCQRCGGSEDFANKISYDVEIVVHHRSYAPEVMEGLADEWLVSLCHGCHAVVHFDESGRRRSSWSEMERVLWTPDTRTDFPEPVIDLRLWSDAREPKEWERMNINRRRGWERRRDKLVEERRTKKTTKKSRRPKSE